MGACLSLVSYGGRWGQPLCMCEINQQGSCSCSER